MFTSRFFIAVLFSAIAAVSTQAASITAAGTQFIGFSDNMEIQWRDSEVFKTYDIDGDNVIGTSAYFLAKTNYGIEPEEFYKASNFDTSAMTTLEASWLFVTAAVPQVNSQLNYSYIDFQNPTQSVEKLKVGYMGRRYSGNMTIGNYYPLYNFAVESKVPEKFTITIAMQSQIGDGLPSGLMLIQIGGKGSDKPIIEINSGAYIVHQNASFTTFVITSAKSGDVFQLLGQAQKEDTLVINGLMVDSAAP